MALVPCIMYNLPLKRICTCPIPNPFKLELVILSVWESIILFSCGHGRPLCFSTKDQSVVSVLSSTLLRWVQLSISIENLTCYFFYFYVKPFPVNLFFNSCVKRKINSHYNASLNTSILNFFTSKVSHHFPSYASIFSGFITLS